MINSITNTYIALCSELCQSPKDFSKKRVKHHNKTYDQLNQFVADFCQNKSVAGAVFANLLQNNSFHVCLCAASHCLKYGICEKTAIEKLEEIELSDDPFFAVQAEMTLAVWRGEMPGRTL